MSDADTATPRHADGPPALDLPRKAWIGKGVVCPNPEALERLSACMAAASGGTIGWGADGDARH